MLGRLGFQFACRIDKGYQSQMDKQGIFPAHVLPQLANGLQEGKRLDVTHGPPNFNDGQIRVPTNLLNGRLDFVGHMRNHLYRLTQIVTPTLFLYDRLVNTTGGQIVITRQSGVGKPFVVTQVEIRLGSIICDKNLTVLIGTHRTWINVEIRIKFL